MKVKTVDVNAVRKAGKLRIARAEAIEAYARFEHSLSIFLCDLLGTTLPKASAVFYKITNASSRNKIFENLIKLEYGNKYRICWHGEGKPGGKDGLFKLIYQLDETRNQIIHWTAARVMTTTDHPQEIETLVQPNRFNFGGESKEISIPDLNSFIKKSDFATGSIHAFSVFNTVKELQVPGSALDPWIPIFQQPVIYPPPSNHPLAQTDKAPETPPQAS